MVARARQGRRLQQLGFGLILLASLEGFVIPLMKVQALAVATHRLGVMEGLLLAAAGLVWRRLKLGPRSALTAFWCALYSALAILAAYGTAAVTGVGIAAVTLPGTTHAVAPGPMSGELAVRLLAYSSGPTVILSLVLIVIGLRSAPGRRRE